MTGFSRERSALAEPDPAAQSRDPARPGLAGASPAPKPGARVSGPLERMGTWFLLAAGLVGGGLGWVVMRLTVLGGCGAWPEAGQACSGFLVEHDGFRLVVDLGYATVPRLLERAAPGQVDAVFISHGHPDHCADLNPLLRARVLREDPAAALPVYALPGALDAVMALDRPETLAGALPLTELSPGGQLEIGPFRAQTYLLPHWVPNVGLRLAAGEAVLAYTGDCGPSPLIAELALQADLLLAEASYVDLIPE